MAFMVKTCFWDKARPLRKDHRPYALKRAGRRFEKFFARRFLAPHFDRLGRGFAFMRPWHVHLFGAPIRLGAFATVIGAPDARVRLSVWPGETPGDGIDIGDYALICPGVRISAAAGIRIGQACMLARGVYVTDADWHGLYDRLALGTPAPVTVADNVWIGDGAIVCKGVTIGANSVVGAGAVVTREVPADCVVAGNPARVVRHLDPDHPRVTRRQWFRQPARLSAELDRLDRAMLRENTWAHWLRVLLFPRRSD